MQIEYFIYAGIALTLIVGGIAEFKMHQKRAQKHSPNVTDIHVAS